MTLPVNWKQLLQQRGFTVNIIVPCFCFLWIVLYLPFCVEWRVYFWGSVPELAGVLLCSCLCRNASLSLSHLSDPCLYTMLTGSLPVNTSFVDQQWVFLFRSEELGTGEFPDSPLTRSVVRLCPCCLILAFSSLVLEKLLWQQPGAIWAPKRQA